VRLPTPAVEATARGETTMPYITYLQNPEQHTNKADSHPGYGETPAEAERNARYWANQLPWVVTVPASRAPKWAQQQARDSRWYELLAIQQERVWTPEEAAEFDAYSAYLYL
jgi:proteasome lid subunit RPN8/RPN11